MIPHIYGLANDMDKILKITKKYKLYLIEDAAEVLGLKYKNKPCKFWRYKYFKFLC